MKTIKELKRIDERYEDGYNSCRRDVKKLIDEYFDKLPVRYNFIRKELKSKIQGD